MKLAEYESLVSGVENGKIEGTAEAIEVRMIGIARECRTALWRSADLRAEAGRIADRAEAIAQKLAPVAATRNHTPAERLTGTYAHHCGHAGQWLYEVYR